MTLDESRRGPCLEVYVEAIGEQQSSIRTRVRIAQSGDLRRYQAQDPQRRDERIARCSNPNRCSSIVSGCSPPFSLTTDCALVMSCQHANNFVPVTHFWAVRAPGLPYPAGSQCFWLLLDLLFALLITAVCHRELIVSPAPPPPSPPPLLLVRLAGAARPWPPAAQPRL